jgi:hypothetical protein
MTNPPRPAPPVQVLGGAVLFRGPAVVDLARLLPAAVNAVTRRDGIPVPNRWRLILAAVAEAMSACPASDVRSEPDSSSWCGTWEVSELLGCSRRQAQRVAQQLGGHRGRHGWLVRRADLEAERQERTNK